ncbi:hypothetical protein ONA70_06940 [Micromonospora yasonensis]|uniref:hypothetical protein n=1 Tax=Micromonospora yasonensis TaxID=1128667 RepID=UPI0022300218|nr:hypothetical protein [Micromonospora yasonensis]MCW3839831.1 hypothetical protein [Micromonospora yasonensis]
MIRLLPARDGVEAHWRLVGRTGAGADVLATGPVESPDEGRRGRATSWQGAVARLRDSAGRLRTDHTSDNHFRWTLLGPDEMISAQSPAVYRDPASCREAFTIARRAARTALGGAQGASGRAARP